MTTPITITKKEPLSGALFEPLKWVASAICKRKQPYRYATNKINITARQIQATDGQRLHIAYKKPYLPPGVYEVTKNIKKKIVIQQGEESSPFPKVESVIPKDLPDYFVSEGGDARYMNYSIPDEQAQESDILTALAKKGVTIQPKYIIDALSVAEHWRIEFGTEPNHIRPIVLKGMNELIPGDKDFEYLAVIMPRVQKGVEYKQRG